MSVYQARKQAQALVKQLNLLTGQQIPYLFIKQKNVEGEKVKLEVENVSNAAALWMGLTTRYFLVRQRYYDAPRSGRELNWGAVIKLREEGKAVFTKYYWEGPDSWPQLVYEGKKVGTAAVVTFLLPRE